MIYYTECVIFQIPLSKEFIYSMKIAFKKYIIYIYYYYIMLTIQTSVVNNPKFIELQYLTLKKFVKGDYKFVVYNHAKDYSDCSNYYTENNNYKKDITSICEKLNIECIDVIDNPNSYKGCPSAGTASAMNYILKNSHIPNPGKYFVIDSDMFLINEMNTDKYNNYDCVYRTCVRNECKYMWNGIYYFDTTKMKNVNLLDWNMFKYTETNPHPGCGYWTDTGGYTHKWIEQEYKNHNIKEIDMYETGKWNENDLKIKLHPQILNFCKNDKRSILNFGNNDKYFSEIYEDCVLHYRAGGNWQGLNKSIHEEAINSLEKSIYDIIKS